MNTGPARSCGAGVPCSSWSSLRACLHDPAKPLDCACIVRYFADVHQATDRSEFSGLEPRELPIDVLLVDEFVMSARQSVPEIIVLRHSLRVALLTEVRRA